MAVVCRSIDIHMLPFQRRSTGLLQPLSQGRYFAQTASRRLLSACRYTSKWLYCRLDLTLNLTGSPLLLKDVALTPKPSQPIQMPVDQYMSTFLFDIASNYKDIPRYLDTLLFSKKRRKSASAHNQHPNKAQKLSRRQKKKLKQANTTTTTPTAQQPSNRIVVIDRSPLFYCTGTPTSNAMMSLPKDSK